MNGKMNKKLIKDPDPELTIPLHITPPHPIRAMGGVPPLPVELSYSARTHMDGVTNHKIEAVTPEPPDMGPDVFLLIKRRDYYFPMRTRLRFSDWNLPCVYCVQCQQPQPKQNKQLHQLIHFPPPGKILYSLLN